MQAVDVVWTLRKGLGGRDQVPRVASNRHKICLGCVRDGTYYESDGPCRSEHWNDAWIPWISSLKQQTGARLAVTTHPSACHVNIVDVTKMPCVYRTVVPWYRGTVVPWYRGTVVPYA
jgi:hypothetical protein